MTRPELVEGAPREASERLAPGPARLLRNRDAFHVHAQPRRAQVEGEQEAERHAVVRAQNEPVLAVLRGDRSRVLRAGPAPDERSVLGMALEGEDEVEISESGRPQRHFAARVDVEAGQRVADLEPWGPVRSEHVPPGRRLGGTVERGETQRDRVGSIEPADEELRAAAPAEDALARRRRAVCDQLRLPAVPPERAGAQLGVRRERGAVPRWTQ